MVGSTRTPSSRRPRPACSVSWPGRRSTARPTRRPRSRRCAPRRRGARGNGGAELFTGIVEERGEVVAVTDLPDAARLTVAGPLVTEDAKPGDSIAVNGVCLTVVDVSAGAFTADVMRETLVRSSLDKIAAGDPVNLERAARVDTRLGGHIVQGHVDGTGVI